MIESQDEENDSNKLSFQFPYSLDGEGFFRRECPKCGLQFKIMAPPDTITTLLAPAFERIGVEYGYEITIPGSDIQKDEEQWICPYCGHQDTPQSFITDDLYEMMRLWIYREYIFPLLNDRLSQFAQEINDIGKRNRGGLISISMKHEANPRPMRPINYPELPDMNKVILLCCREEIKIKSGWFGTIFCPYCSSELVLT